MDNNILSVNNLTKNFGNKIAVDNVNFAVRRGEILGILGPNGAGKTTAIRMIMGIFPPTKGKINYFFKKRGFPKDAIGYLPEERGLYNDSKVLDILIYLAHLKGVPRQEAKQLANDGLAKMDLSDYSKVKLEKLSKGMQQKIQFLAAVIHHPELVVLDEPFSGLDPVNQELFLEMIRDLNRGGMTVLLSSHQMNLVEEICSRIYMIHKGKQVLSGTIQDIKLQHGGGRVGIHFQPGSGNPDGIGCADIIHRDTGQAQYQLKNNIPVSTFAREAASKLNLLSLENINPPLHDIFIETVRKRGEEVE